MTLDQLRYFVCVAQEGHMGKAARLLHVTASTLSQAIKGLEDSLGMSLFLRDGRKLVLTDSGERLVVEGAHILSSVNSLSQRLSMQPKTTLINCGGPPSLTSSLLIPAIRHLEKELVAFDFKFSYVPSSEVQRQVMEGHLDFGIKFIDKRPLDHGEEEIILDRLYACARHAHPLFKVAPQDRLKSIHEYPLVSPQPIQAINGAGNTTMNKIVAKLCRLQYIIPSYEDGMRIIADNNYWGLFPGWIIRTNSSRLAKVVDSDLCPEVMICGMTSENSPLQEFLPLLLTTLRAMAGT